MPQGADCQLTVKQVFDRKRPTVSGPPGIMETGQGMSSGSGEGE